MPFQSMIDYDNASGTIYKQLNFDNDLLNKGRPGTEMKNIVDTVLGKTRDQLKQEQNRL